MFIMYSKQTGAVKSVASGNSYSSIKQLYPYEYEDYEIIYDFIVINEDKDEVIQHPNRFKINLTTKELERQQQLTVEDLIQAGLITAEQLKNL